MSGRGTSETNGDEVRRSACGRQSGHRVQGGSNGRLCATLTASKHIVLGPCLSDKNIEPWLLRSRVGCLRSKAAYAPREQRLQLAILWFRARQNMGWSGCGETRFPQQQVPIHAAVTGALRRCPLGHLTTTHRKTVRPLNLKTFLIGLFDPGRFLTSVFERARRGLGHGDWGVNFRPKRLSDSAIARGRSRSRQP